MIDIIGGHTKVMFSSLVQTTPHIKSGKLRAIATGGLKRSPVLPDVPTVAESGVPTYEAVNWWGIVAPAGTPQPIIDRLSAAIAAVQSAPETQKQFSTEGAEVAKMTPAEFGAFMVKETKKWETVVRRGDIKAE
jgi:tripartite-type tricarboxylate transporter receptor subunit TctC